MIKQLFIILIVFQIIVYINTQYCDQNIAGSCLNPNSQHRNLKKYTQSNINQSINEDFSDDKINQIIINYFHYWSEVKLHPTIHYDTGQQLKTPHLGLKKDESYCQKSDIWKLQHPESIFDNYFIMTDFRQSELPRKIANKFGVDVLPKVYMGMDPKLNDQQIYDVPLETSLLNSRISRFHHFLLYSKCMICLFQTSNHIPGKWSLTGKDLVINNLRKYTQKPFKNSQQCINTIEFMPPSYRLYNKQECIEFFEYLNTEEYKQKIEQEGIRFILKRGRDIHRGNGISLLLPENQQKLVERYQNGQKCGQVKQKNALQAQTYITNPMLYKGRKIEVRIYFLIASTDPLIIYSQNLAHLRMCGEDFDLFSKKKEVHVCNVAVADKSKDKDYVVDFSLDGLRDYLIEEGIITNKKWLEEEIYPQIYKAIIHLVRLGEHDLLKDSKVYENFALDFLLDSNSKIWFMENNPNPQIMQISKARADRHTIMFGDIFEIQFNYLRSRFKRLLEVAKLMKNDIKNANSDKYKKLFQKANKNKLEPEYQISHLNTYQKIYDENEEGVNIFMGNLPEGCLYENQQKKEEL